MPRRHVQRGFSFVELLFAMAILSFGILGIAASLYVGVGQTAAALDQTNAAAIAREATAVMGQLMNQVNTAGGPDTFQLVSETSTVPPPAPAGTPSLATLLKPLQIDSTDSRYAWIPLYHHVEGPTADVVIFVLRASARSAFGPADLMSPTSAYLPGLAPTPVTVDVQADAATNEMVLHVSDKTAVEPGGRQCIAPGAIVFLNGTASSGVQWRVVRVSAPLGLDTWSLVPGEDLVGVSPTSNVPAFAVGRGYRDPAHPELGYDGDNQAIAAYATTVLLR